jgi:hypothetical protein
MEPDVTTSVVPWANVQGSAAGLHTSLAVVAKAWGTASRSRRTAGTRRVMIDLSTASARLDAT